jgi:DNA-binding CsgD family transcriptional regulator
LIDERAREEITIAVRIADPTVADRIVMVLGDIAGVRLVTPGEPADAVLVSPGMASTEDEFAAPTDDGVHSAAMSSTHLTAREREVLALLAEGASNKTIARRLGISVHTVKFHVGSLLEKLDATGRTDAVTHAARLGVIQL